MNIGIIGVGTVGSALALGFRRIGHAVHEHDTKLMSDVDIALKAPLVFICVPTPLGFHGECDTSIVEEVVADIARRKYHGLIAIKSTVTPGTTDRLTREYPELHICFCPEFLRERAAFSDFVENNEVCIVGTRREQDYWLICEAHGKLPKHFVRLSPLEAELAKYFVNTFNALRIVFANQFCEVCDHIGADYMAIKNAVSKRSSIGDHYLSSSPGVREFGGSCLPKDTFAFAEFVRALDIDANIFAMIVTENERIKRRGV